MAEKEFLQAARRAYRGLYGYHDGELVMLFHKAGKDIRAALKLVDDMLIEDTIKYMH